MSGDVYQQDLIADYVAGELLLRLQAAVQGDALTLAELNALTVTHAPDCRHWAGSGCVCGRVLAVIGRVVRVEIRIDGSIHRVTCQ